MSKNSTRIAVLLMALVMITTCFASGTMAKYVTSGTSEDSASVAKWGVTVEAMPVAGKDGTADRGNIFHTSYKDASGTNDIAVSSDTTADIVAPGTSGQLGQVVVYGTPEVAVKVSYEGAFELTGTWQDKDGDFYCPIVIKVNGTAIKGTDHSSVNDFISAVNSAIDGYSKEYAPGTDLMEKTETKAEALAVSWEWPFETEGNDEKDTELGDKVANNTSVGLTMEITTTVSQINSFTATSGSGDGQTP